MSSYEKALDVLSSFITLRSPADKGSKCSRFEFVFDYIKVISEFGKYDIFFLFFFSGPNCICYDFILDSGLGGANFKDDNCPRSWHQREGTKLCELVLICNRNLCEE